MKRALAVVAAASICLLMAQAPGQEPSQEPVDSHMVIRSDTRLVLVDTVVTDKKGNYVRDLTQKDFKVYEDNKEQTISSFSFETDAAAADSSRKHYLVLFFDNSTAGHASAAGVRASEPRQRSLSKPTRPEPADGDRGVRRGVKSRAEFHRRCGPAAEAGGGGR